MRRLAASLLMVASLLGAGQARPAGPFEAARPSVRVYGIEEGLPNDTPYALMLDQRGRLWAGTQEGVAVLGGRGWTSLVFPPEAASTFIRCLLEDPDGTVWLGTQDDGLWALRSGTWTHYRPGHEISAVRINRLARTASGDLLAATWGQGVLKLDRGAWVPLDVPAAMRDPYVWNLRETLDAHGDRQLWICGQDSLVTLRHQIWTRMDASLGFRPGGANDLVQVTDPMGQRTIWAACWGQGVARWDGATWTYFGKGSGFPSLTPTSFAVVGDGTPDAQIYAGTFDAGLARFHDGAWEAVSTLRGAGAGTRQITGVYTLLANPGGHPALWFGGRGTGVVALDPRGWRTLDRESGLPSPFALSFLETPRPGGSSAFYVGTDRGIARWEGGQVTLEGTAQGLPSPVVNALASLPLPGGPQVWAATLRGLARREGGHWRPVGAADGVRFDQCTSLATGQDPGGGPLLFAGFEGGLALLRGGRWTSLGPAEGLPQPSVFSLLYSQGDQALWVGFRAGGVARFKDGAWLHFGADSGLPNLSVHGLAASTSPDGRRWLWAGTLGGGVARLDMDHPDRGWQVFNQKTLPDLPSQTIHRLEWDRRGRLYLMTARGVVRLTLTGPDGHPDRLRTFTQGDGLPSTALNFGASYLDPEGRVWAGTSKGVGILDPDLSEDLGAPPQPQLERCLVGGQERWPAPGLSLDHRVRAVGFEFNLPVFHRREDIRYRTQLEGFEPEPTDWRTEARREFTRLPGGHYRLKIWARDAFGRVSGPLVIPLRMATPPWYRWWAWLAYTAILGLLVRSAFQLRLRILRDRNLALEKLVADRTQALEDANLALHAQTMTDPLTGLYNRRALLQAIPDDMLRLFRRFSKENWDTQIIGSHNRDLVFLMVDLDHFKEVNDAFGHQAGDQVLQQMSDILRASVRETDRIVRWGGEEFLVVARDTQADEVSQLAERIRSGVSSHVFHLVDHPPIRKTCSVGFACFPVLLRDPGLFSWEQVVDLADQCLYQAKHGGRNRWVGILPREDADPDLAFDPRKLSVDRLAELGLVTRLASQE